MIGGTGGMGTLVARATKQANKIDFFLKFVSVIFWILTVSGICLSVLAIVTTVNLISL